MTTDSKRDPETIASNKARYGDIISDARHRAGLTQQEVGRALGISKNMVTHWEAGRVKPDLNLIPELCGVLHLTLEEFFRQPAASDGMSAHELDLLKAYRTLSSRDKLIFECALMKTQELGEEALWARCRADFIPMYRNHQTAAAGIAASLDAAEGERVFIRRNRLSERAREIVTVNGDSMRPKYLNGQDVYVETAANLRIGEIGIFVVNGAGYIKQRQADRLHSLNPAYPDILLRDTDDVRCYGRVLGPVAPADYPSREEQAILDELH